jgi:hypothetical protein
VNEVVVEGEVGVGGGNGAVGEEVGFEVGGEGADGVAVGGDGDVGTVGGGGGDVGTVGGGGGDVGTVGGGGGGRGIAKISTTLEWLVELYPPPKKILFPNAVAANDCRGILRLAVNQVPLVMLKKSTTELVVPKSSIFPPPNATISPVDVAASKERP